MQNDQQQIRNLVQIWMEASKAGDIETVLGLMTDDVVFLTPGNAPMLGKETFAQATRGQVGDDAPQFDGKSEIQEIQVLGDWAYMWTHLTVVVTPPGSSPMTRAGHTLTIFKRVGGKWLLHRDANLLAPVAGL